MGKYKSRIRIFVIKEDDESQNGFEVLDHEIFSNELYSTRIPKEIGILSLASNYEFRPTPVQSIEEDISNIGFEGIMEDIQRILEPYEVEDVVEILADYNVEWYHYSTMDGPEYDQHSCLDNEISNKLTDDEIRNFIADFDRDKDNRIIFKNNDTFNHGL